MYHFQNQLYGKPHDNHSYNKCKDSEVAHTILPRSNLAMAASEVKLVYKPQNKQMSYTMQLS
jgi:hypothetical protein